MSIVIRYFLCAVLLVMGPGLAGAGERLAVTFINPGGVTEFWGDVAATMTAAAEDLEIDLEVIHTDRDRVRMVNAAEEVAKRAETPDYAIIVNELQQAPVMLAAMQAAGIPVFVLLNRMTDEQRRAHEAAGGDLSLIVGSIVPDNEIAGYEMALSLIAAARERGLDADGIDMLALLGDAATPAALAREAGLMRALAEHPDVRLLRSFPVMWSAETAYERTRAVLGRFDVDAVWAANDQISLGAQRAAVESGGVPGETMVFAGLNWSEGGLTGVRDGTMTMTHGGHFFAGAWSMVMLRDLADGALAPGAHVTFPMSAVRADTVDRFLEQFGTRDWQSIDFRAFTRPGDAGYRFTADAILEATARSSAER